LEDFNDAQFDRDTILRSLANGDTLASGGSGSDCRWKVPAIHVRQRLNEPQDANIHPEAQESVAVLSR